MSFAFMSRSKTHRRQTLEITLIFVFLFRCLVLAFVVLLTFKATMFSLSFHPHAKFSVHGREGEISIKF